MPLPVMPLTRHSLIIHLIPVIRMPLARRAAFSSCPSPVMPLPVTLLIRHSLVPHLMPIIRHADCSLVVSLNRHARHPSCPYPSCRLTGHDLSYVMSLIPHAPQPSSEPSIEAESTSTIIIPTSSSSKSSSRRIACDSVSGMSASHGCAVAGC